MIHKKGTALEQLVQLLLLECLNLFHIAFLTLSLDVDQDK